MSNQITYYITNSGPAIVRSFMTSALSRDEAYREQADEVVKLFESWSRSKRKMIYAYLNANGERLDNCTSYDIDKAFKDEYEKQ